MPVHICDEARKVTAVVGVPEKCTARSIFRPFRPIKNRSKSLTGISALKRQACFIASYFDSLFTCD
jgi:hypothetical protein